MLSVLEKHGKLQSNLGSEACREAVTDSIISEVSKHFTFSVKPFLPIDFAVDVDKKDEFEN